MDYLGPSMNTIFLVVIDAHIKWIVSSASSETTVRKLRHIFSTHGLPLTIVSDNSTPFTGEEFQKFLTMNGIRHITCALYHPASNGLAERAVQIMKQGLRKQTDGDIETRVDRFPFSYRNTPHTTTGCTTAELLLRRKPRSRLNLLHPERKHHVEVKQEQQQQYRNEHTRQRSFADGQDVYVSQRERGTSWLPAVVTKQSG